MRALVTGARGFAGRHLVAHLEACGDTVLESSRATGTDLLDADAARAAVAAARPDVVYHLAADAHVGRSWSDPEGYMRRNVAMTANVLEAVRAVAPGARTVYVSSGEVYGAPSVLPVGEDAPLRPQNPYAASKASADLLAGFYADGYGLDVVRARAFNHAGPGQEPVYAIASFARQVAEGAGRAARQAPERAGAAGRPVAEDAVVVRTGNAATRRDYTDVRDVVRAYRLLGIAERNEPGAIYNVCSGTTRSAADLVAALGAAAGVPVDHQVDPGLVRDHEVLEIRGSAAKLRSATGWKPLIPLEQTLSETFASWKMSVS